MISTVLNSFTDVSGMAWVERYGGLIRKAERAIENKNGKIVKELYPVSSSVTDVQCWEKGRFKDLGPNDRYYSVIYYEQTGSIKSSDRSISRGRKMFDFTAPIRLVVWLNYKKLGLSTTDNLAGFKVETLKNLCANKTIVGSSTYLNIKVSDPNIEDRETTVKNFKQYTNSQDQKIFFYPYDVFSISFNLNWSTPADCATAITPGTPIDCVNLTE